MMIEPLEDLMKLFILPSNDAPIEKDKGEGACFK